MMDISKKAIIIISVILILSVSAVINISAESIWEGSAAMGRYGEFPMTGYYGASNSFPQNTYVEVENLESGKRIRLIIVDRLSDSGLLMLVSNEAAQELGIFQNDISRIKVRLLSAARTEKALEYDDLAYNPDPDINPAASLISSEELAYNQIESTRNETASGTVATKAAEEAQAAETVVTEAEDPVENEAVKTIEIVEAEVLITPDEVSKTASDIPEQPFDWPDTIIEETKPEPDPLYLTMDNLDEVLPAPEAETPSDLMPPPEALGLWPDDSSNEALAEASDESEEAVLGRSDLAEAAPSDSAEAVSGDYDDTPEARLELISSGLAETQPVLVPDIRFTADALPEISEKAQDEGEYVTEATGYYSPEIRERNIENNNLPAPEPSVPEEVISALVGDSIFLSEAFPDAESLNLSYIETPVIEESTEIEDRNIQPELAEAFPMPADGAELVSADFPELPGAGEKFPVEVADGYVSPDDEVFVTNITDFPVYRGSDESAEIPATGDDIAYNEAPASDDVISELPEVAEVPELTGTVSAEETGIDANPVTDDTEPAVPAYDENLEVSLEPAEERPPELVSEDTALAEAEPNAADSAANAEHAPEAEVAVEEPEVVEVPAVAGMDVDIAGEAAVSREPSTDFSVSIPDRLVMADKLEQKRHYLQLGAFRERNSALRAAGKLEQGYPVTILTDGGGEVVSYKLLLGPLSEDESGALLYNFRAGGYSDAFIRRIE